MQMSGHSQDILITQMSAGCWQVTWQYKCLRHLGDILAIQVSETSGGNPYNTSV